MNSNSISTKQIRTFGIIALIFFGSLFALGIWKDKPIPTYLFGTLCAFGFGFTIIPARLKPVYAAWLKITHFIGRVLTILMLTLAFYLVITPSSIIKRVIGGRPLPVKPNKNATSYWVPRAEAVQPIERYKKRF